MRYAEKLRRFADYLDAHPVLAEEVNNRWEHPSVYIVSQSWDDFQKIIKDLDGFTKGGYNGDLTARHVEEDEDGGNIFRATVTVSGICEAKPKVDDEGNPVTRPKTKVVETGEVEQVMEYDCPTVWTQA